MVKVTKLGLFLGEYRHNLTDKNRLALPKRVRIEIDDFEVILAQGDDQCVVGYTKQKWEEMAKHPLSIPAYEEQGRMLRRRLFSTAVVVEMDIQGRLVLPEKLVVWARLAGQVGEELVIVGAGDHFEIWQSQAWQTYSQKLYS